MEKNEIRGYEPLVEELKQLIHKKQYHVLKGKRLNFRHGYKNPRPHFCNRSTLIIHI